MASIGGKCPVTLYYVHDPMCSWCWAFRPTWAEIVNGLPDNFKTQRVLGGLAPDSGAPMPESTRVYIQETWRRIQRVVSGTEFNFDFWSRCRPRRSTYAACRAVIAAMKQGIEHEEPMILAIQEAYYLQARNPSDDDTLIQVAASLGLQEARFGDDLNGTETRAELLRQIGFGQAIGAKGFPSLILERDGAYRTLAYDYRDPSVVLKQLRADGASD